MEATPKSWARCTVDDVAAPEPGAFVDGPFGSNLKTEHYTSSGPRVLRLENVGDGVFRDAETYVSQSHFDRLRRHEARADDVIIALLGDKVPRACLVPPRVGPAIVKADCPRLRPDTRLALSQFVMYALNSDQVRRQAKALVHGVGRPRLKLSELRGLTVPLPPLAEQRRIVDALETQFTRLDAAVATLERVRANLNRYRAAVLQAAIEGRLFGASACVANEGLPPAWSWTTIAKLTPQDRPSAYGVLQPGPDVADGVPLVRVMDIGDGRIDGPSLKRIAPSIAKRYPRTCVRGGEVLLSIVGTIGRTAIVPRALAGANTARAIAVIPVRDGVEPRWVELALRAPRTVAELTRASHEVARKTLNLEDVRAARIPLPPREEQDGIVAEAERLLSDAGYADALLSACVLRLGRLRQSLLRLAFSGRLVPQDPADEPTSVLLDRIRRERAADAAPAKRKTSRSRS